MKSKVWLTIFAVIALLFIGASGFFAFSSFGKYSEAQENWSDKVGTINSLEKKPLYPNKDNVRKLSDLVSEYQKSVSSLFTSLDQFQKKLNTSMANIEFQDTVKTKVSEFRRIASEANFEIVQNDSFQLGFDAYSNSVPSPDIVPILNYELEAIDHLLKKIITAGGDSMYIFSRDLIPGEIGGPDRQESGVVHKYPVRLGINCSHRAFQNFMNSISNDKEYFYIVRVMEIQNEIQEGPLKTRATTRQALVFENKESGAPASMSDMSKWGFPNASEAEIMSAAAADGYAPSGRDARVLMGQEKLQIFMVIDIVRFLDPSGVDGIQSENANAKKGKR